MAREQINKKKRKDCVYCANKTDIVDYKDVQKLRSASLTETGKIRPRRASGNCAKHQRQLAKAIRRAREAALIPYVFEN